MKQVQIKTVTTITITIAQRRIIIKRIYLLKTVRRNMESCVVMVDRWVADAGDWRVGDEYQATVSSDQRRTDDSSYHDHCRRCDAPVNGCHRRRWRN